MSNLAQIASALRDSHKRTSRLSGRLVMALDATASRSATWSATRSIMSSIFRRLEALGDLSISVGYFRGFEGDCQFTDFAARSADLESAMALIECHAGSTQIRQVLTHFVEAAGATERPAAFVFIGDDQQEDAEALLAQARTLAAFGIPTFWFLERTRDTSPADEADFKALAIASGGAFAEFTESAAEKLEELLVAAATFAIGGRAALAKRGGEAARLLLTQLK